jgi:AraC-like DNA-binding protein
MKAVLEKVSAAPRQSINAFVYTGVTFDAPWHFHPEYELTYITGSSGIRYVGNHVGDFHVGDLVLLGSRLPHCWKNVGEPKDGTEASSIIIQWPERLIGDLPELAEINALLQRAKRGVRFSPAVAQNAKKSMREMVEAPPLQAYLLLLSLLGELSRIDASLLADKAYAYDGSGITSERLQLIQQFVTDNYQRKISLAEVAALVNLSEQAFSRFFSQAMGRPFFRFLNQYRINVAGRQLLEADDAVAKVGYDCGYDSLPFFYRQFKLLKGCTPAGFRRKFRSSQSTGTD